MNYIIEKLENNLLTYDPNEFFPIWQDGQLTNRNKFIAYKARRAVLSLVKR